MARFTFFEYAQQNGHVMALLRGRLTKHHEVKITVEGGTRVIRASTHAAPAPFFVYHIPEREFSESSLSWQARVEQDVHDQWYMQVVRKSTPDPVELPPEPTPTAEEPEPRAEEPTPTAEEPAIEPAKEPERATVEPAKKKATAKAKKASV